MTAQDITTFNSNITTDNDLLSAYGALYVYSQQKNSAGVTATTDSEVDHDLGQFGIHSMADLTQAITICTDQATARGITPDRMTQAIADAQAVIAGNTAPPAGNDPVPPTQPPVPNSESWTDMFSDPNTKKLLYVIGGGLAFGLLAMGIVKEEKKKTVAALIAAIAGSSMGFLYAQNQEEQTAKSRTAAQKTARKLTASTIFHSADGKEKHTRISARIKSFFNSEGSQGGSHIIVHKLGQHQY